MQVDHAADAQFITSATGAEALKRPLAAGDRVLCATDVARMEPLHRPLGDVAPHRWRRDNVRRGGGGSVIAPAPSGAVKTMPS